MKVHAVNTPTHTGNLGRSFKATHHATHNQRQCTLLSNPDYNTPSFGNPDSLQRRRGYDFEVGNKVSRIFNVLAGTGEILQLSAPEGLQNTSYTIDLIIPLVRCQQ